MAEAEEEPYYFSRVLDALRSNEESRLGSTRASRRDGERLRIVYIPESNNLTESQFNSFASALRNNIHVQVLGINGAYLYRDNHLTLVIRVLETVLPYHKHIKRLHIVNFNVMEWNGLILTLLLTWERSF